MKPLWHPCGESYTKWMTVAQRQVIQERITFGLISTEIRYLIGRLASVYRTHFIG